MDVCRGIGGSHSGCGFEDHTCLDLEMREMDRYVQSQLTYVDMYVCRYIQRVLSSPTRQTKPPVPKKPALTHHTQLAT
jgi:hypothetical protein